MLLLCERCYAPIDPVDDRFYRLAHIDHADLSGEITWRESVVHVDPCVTAGTGVPAGERGRAA